MNAPTRLEEELKAATMAGDVKAIHEILQKMKAFFVFEDCDGVIGDIRYETRDACVDAAFKDFEIYCENREYEDGYEDWAYVLTCIEDPNGEPLEQSRERITVTYGEGSFDPYTEHNTVWRAL